MTDIDILAEMKGNLCMPPQTEMDKRRVQALDNAIKALKTEHDLKAYVDGLEKEIKDERNDRIQKP